MMPSKRYMAKIIKLAGQIPCSKWTLASIRRKNVPFLKPRYDEAIKYFDTIVTKRRKAAQQKRNNRFSCNLSKSAHKSIMRNKTFYSYVEESSRTQCYCCRKLNVVRDEYVRKVMYDTPSFPIPEECVMYSRSCPCCKVCTTVCENHYFLTACICGGKAASASAALMARMATISALRVLNKLHRVLSCMKKNRLNRLRSTVAYQTIYSSITRKLTQGVPKDTTHRIHCLPFEMPEPLIFSFCVLFLNLDGIPILGTLKCQFKTCKITDKALVIGKLRIHVIPDNPDTDSDSDEQEDDVQPLFRVVYIWNKTQAKCTYLSKYTWICFF